MKKLGYVVVAALCLGTVANAYALTQAETAKQAEEALKAGNMTKMVGMLPSSYVKDINTVIQTFAEKMDEELWQKGRETVAIAVDVLAAQSKNALSGESMIPVNLPASNEEAEKNMREGLKGLATFLRGDAMALKALKKGDVAALASALTPAFSKITAAVNSGDDSPVSFSAPDTMKQVEGKWVSAEMADGWKEKIDSALAGIKEMDFASEKGKAQKTQIMTVMDSMQGVLKQMENAKTPEDFQKQLPMLMMPLMMMQMQMQE